MKQYHELLEDILQNGTKKEDRTGTGTISVFGRQMRFDLQEGFPLVDTKKIFWKGVVYELLWFLKGDTNIKYLNNNGIHFWDHWADEDGDLGPIYGQQWRNWPGYKKGHDQIKNVIENIKKHPYSRRHIVSTWNVDDLEYMKLLPCHPFIQFYVADNQLSCSFYMRSNDIFLGCPYNIASYALLTRMIAQVCNFRVKELIWSCGDAHIYLNHLNQVHEQLSRYHQDLADAACGKYRSQPAIKLNPEIKDIDQFDYKDIKLIGYEPRSAIKAPIAI